jgi:Uma2 family endonuclease
MSTQAKTKPTNVSDRDRVPYLFSADQVLKIVESEIIPPDVDVELWDGVIYKLTKCELHNFIVAEVADLLRHLTPANFHVREEKCCSADPASLPEPDVAVCEGRRFDYLPDPPPLSKLNLVVEVSHHTDHADLVEKMAKYGEAGVPVYWVVHAIGRTLTVYTRPKPIRGGSRYSKWLTYRPGEEVEVVIGGEIRGSVSVAGMFPPDSQR